MALSINRILVGLDFSDADIPLLKYTSFLCSLVNPVRVYFVHIHRSLDIPEEIRKKIPQLRQPLDEHLEEQMKETVENIFGDNISFKTEFIVHEGSPLKEILRWAHIKNIDLLLAGRKKTSQGSGILPQELSRKISCPVLLVPVMARPVMKKIFLPLDFSSYSDIAFQYALKLAEASHAEICCYHVTSLPSGYYTTGKSEEEFFSILKEHALSKYQKLLRKFRADQKTISILIEPGKKSIAYMVNTRAHAEKADLILIGARGHTNASALLLGSLTEKVIRDDYDIPVLVVKQKNKKLSFWEMIKEI
ncbi:MAG: hypothetical protein KatS3mg031_1670 [Chitinophagales bacterium]|nr:MAG: hypothetical protein KatS3mg031_1670 [Chitinophagales bacterium]